MKAVMILGMVAIAIFFSWLISYPLMLLWNMTLVPALPFLGQVTWLQMWGIYVLTNALFNATDFSAKK